MAAMSTQSRWKPSVVVAAVIEHEGRFLLVEEHTPEGLRLNNPAGHLELAETPLEAVMREVLEETTCTFEPQAIVGVYLSRFLRRARGEDVTFLRICYAGRVGEPDASRKLDHGIVRTVWMTADALRRAEGRHRSPMVMRCIDDYLAGRRLPLDAVVGDATLKTPFEQR
jgi:8-oxo-dGTP pyrophosphatase MutT (NUDIX family)